MKKGMYKVVITHHDIKMAIFSLPSPGAPVLTGMRELEQLGAILGCQTGRYIIGGSEARQLAEKAAEEFKLGAILASLQVCEPFVTWEICCHPQYGPYSFSKDSGGRLWL